MGNDSALYPIEGEGVTEGYPYPHLPRADFAKKERTRLQQSGLSQHVCSAEQDGLEHVCRPEGNRQGQPLRQRLSDERQGCAHQKESEYYLLRDCSLQEQSRIKQTRSGRANTREVQRACPKVEDGTINYCRGRKHDEHTFSDWRQVL